jgi:REP element-mobilizing transposase RayT
MDSEGRRCTWSCAGTSAKLFRKLAQQNESRIEERHLMPDHLHILISIPPMYAVS